MIFFVKGLLSSNYMLEMEHEKIFVVNEEMPWQELGGGIQRKIIAYDENLMLVKVRFEKGGIGAAHQHHHTQITHVESGIFEVHINGKKKILAAGDAFYVPSNTIHGCTCLEKGILIDVFSPAREDFIQANE